MLMVNIGSTSVGGRVVAIKGESVAHLSLTMPVCTQEDEKVALSRRVEGHWRCVPPLLRAAPARSRPPAPRPLCPLMIRLDKLSLSELVRPNDGDEPLSYVWTYEARRLGENSLAGASARQSAPPHTPSLPPRPPPD